MRCVICKHGETRHGTTTVTLERDPVTLVIKHVPARVCANCGEAYFDATVTDTLLAMVNTTVAEGVQAEVRASPIAQAS